MKGYRKKISVNFTLTRNGNQALVKCVFCMALYVIQCFFSTTEFYLRLMVLGNTELSASNDSKLIFN